MSEQATDSNSADEQGDDWAAAMAEQGAAESAATEEGGAEKAGYKKAEFDDLASQPVAQGAGEANLDVILDIPVTLSMEIGRTEIAINDLLQLGQGSVVELERLAGEPMDVMVNGTLIAHGEVVVVDEKFGIRLTDVISPTERIKKLK
ncbi:MAG: flagellar motor switch protein FliN [Gammaproteobacteria bacterium]|nr:flagellar motor switch protein FliN [Gammaproteobacteria bacterium]